MHVFCQVSAAIVMIRKGKKIITSKITLNLSVSSLFSCDYGLHSKVNKTDEIIILISYSKLGLLLLFCKTNAF